MPKTMVGPPPSLQDDSHNFNYIIGDTLHQRFEQWALLDQDGYVRAGERIRLFCRWLTETQDGDVALRRINNTPRQLFLPFDD